MDPLTHRGTILAQWRTARRRATAPQLRQMEKTLARVRERIDNRQYYEAHQAVRTVVARYVRQKNYEDAAELLYSSSLLLLQAGESGSGIDLLQYLLTIYETAKVPLDIVSKGRVAQIVWQIAPADPSLRQVAQQVGAWASRNGGFATGDPELHHVFGLQLSRAGQGQLAEGHLLLGIRDSAIELARMHRRWYRADDNKANAPLYISRGVLGYLSVENLRNVHVYLEEVLIHFAGDVGVPATPVEGVTIVEGHPILTFLQLLVQTAETKEAVAYRELAQLYNPRQFGAWNAVLNYIEATYFGIQAQRQLNLMDLMGGMFSGQ